MTNMPEAKLAREAELPYASVAMVTDYDCWHEAIATTSRSTADHRRAARQRGQGAASGHGLAAKLGRTRPPSPIDTCLDDAHHHRARTRAIRR